MFLVLSVNAFNAPNLVIDSLNLKAEASTISFQEKISLSEDAFELAKKNGYLKGQYKAAILAGLGYMGLNQLEKAIHYFKTAYRIGEQMGSPTAIAEANFHMGEVYYLLKNLPQAKEAFSESLSQFEQLDSIKWLGVLKNALGVIIYAEGDKEKGAAMYKEAYDILSQAQYEVEAQSPLNNLADHYFHQGKIEQAQLAFEKVLAIDRKYKSAYGETLSLLNLAWCYRKKKQYDEALSLIQESLCISEDKEIKQHILLAHTELSHTYKEMKNFESALLHAEKYNVLKDSLNLLQKETRINDLMVQFETEKKEKQLAISRQEIENLQQQKKIEWLTAYFILGISLLSLLAAFLFISRHKVKRRLDEIELQNQRLLSEKLQQQLYSKTQDLTNLALDISRKNSFSNEVHQALLDIDRTSNFDERKKKIQLLLKLTSNHLRMNEDAQEFQINIETVNNDFFNKLESQFSGLTANDKHLCGLIRLNLSTKDIASIKNISPKSVEMGRYRLRKKLNLDPEEDLSDFLQNFN
ncbi:MAG: tetratricopeptide repeat protein [Saprospiraceae bacterium]